MPPVYHFQNSFLEHHEDASALLARAPIDEVGGGHILAGVTHRFIDCDLVVSCASGAAAQQQLADLRAAGGIASRQLAAANRRRREGVACLDEEMAARDDRAVQLAARRTIANRRDMRAGTEPVSAQHRRGGAGAE